MWAKPVTRVGPVLGLELQEAAAVDDPGDHLPHVVRRCGCRRSTTPYSWPGRRPGRRSGSPARAGRAAAPRVATMARTMARAWRSSAARWSVTPDRRACRSPPPSSSARHHLAGRRFHQRRAAEEDGALVGHDDRLVAHGRHVGPAGGARSEHGRDLGDAGGRQVGLVVEDAAEVVPVGEHLVLGRQERPARVDQVDAREPVLAGHLLGPEVLFDRDGVVGAPLDGGVVGDDDAAPARTPGRPGDDPGRRGIRRRTSRWRRGATAPGTAIPGRAGAPPGRGAAACPARCAVSGKPRARRRLRCAAARAGPRPAPGGPLRCDGRLPKRGQPRCRERDTPGLALLSGLMPRHVTAGVARQVEAYQAQGRGGYQGGDRQPTPRVILSRRPAGPARFPPPNHFAPRPLTKPWVATRLGRPGATSRRDLPAKAWVADASGSR